MAAQISQLGESSLLQSGHIFGSYDVFLSFRGEDMAKNTFKDDLYARLRQFEINVGVENREDVMRKLLVSKLLCSLTSSLKTCMNIGYKSKFIQKIIEVVLWELNRKYMDVAKHPIGIDYRVKYLSSLLSKSEEEVVMVGICGIGGVGKTTLAKAMFNQIYKQFEGSCFLADVRSEASEKHDGLLHLQKKLLYETLKTESFRENNKVLIVLDDVDHRNQLEALAGNRDWFGSGSRVIITTRDEHLLNLVKVDERYVALGLNSDEATHLFSWHASQNPVPLEEYVDVAKDIVAYAQGLPLALTVLGSSLFGLSIEEWRNTVEKLKRIPDDNIQEKLKISFDALPDDKVKAIFLDISCCLRGVDKDDAVTILDACDFFAEAGIQDLLDRCLLTIDINNRLVMHGLIQDMGREIVRQESPDEPGRRSRLFFEEDISNVLLGDKATEVVEVMMVNSPMFKDMQLSTKAFAKMANLRLLQIDNVHLKGKFEHLPNKLKWLRWKHCPLKYIRSNFHLETLVALDMSESKFEGFKASLKKGCVWNG
ncbi:disease resistance protein RUN1-like [Capsicum annuum]|uniref:disease resistance protein RUN1-like n=1 Tax=Capsicum annuum TaxID=4072 RepID=UPI001FB08F36|nr:disease resistance protein RUN1-like [Capsicum annuum]